MPRQYLSRHDAIGELPLVTRSATVTEVERLDRDRREGARRAVARWLAARELDDEFTAPTGLGEWEPLVGALGEAGHARIARRVAALAERVHRERPALVRARFRTDADLDYLAGQYVGLRYGEHARAYSLANAPGEGELEVCVRRVPGGRLSTRLCDELAPGDELTVRGPHGEMVPGEPSGRDLVFLATGTGVAPFKAMIDHLFRTDGDEHRGRRRNVWLFLGAAWEDDLPYRGAFRELAAERSNFRFVPCLSREPYLSDWDGETDYVQHALLRYVDADAVTEPVGARFDERLRRRPVAGGSRGVAAPARIDPSNVDVYACGINAMVHELTAAVRRLGVPDRRIEAEGFG